MSRADFNYIPINRELNSWAQAIDAPVPIHVANGREISDDAYLLITVRNVSSDKHRITINNKALDATDPIDIPSPPGGSGAFMTYMKHIDPGVLQPGANTLRIFREANDTFYVKNAVVHWREV